MTRDWDRRADQLAHEAIGSGEPTAWFDRLYAEGVAGEVSMPWDRTEPQALLVAWADRVGLSGAGLSAVVVGCGLGADAEFLAARGFETTAFDVTPTAVSQAAARHPGTTVDYRVADLLHLAPDLVGRFDLVVEIFTLQALPDPPRAAAAAAVRSLAAEGGRLLAVAFATASDEPAQHGPPYPLTRAFMASLGGDVLTTVSLDLVEDRWVGEYRRRPGA